MPYRFHILNDEACRRRARSTSPEKASNAGKNASSAPYSVLVRSPVCMAAWPYQRPPRISSARYLLMVGILAFHMSRQSLSPKRSQHFHKYPYYESKPPLIRLSAFFKTPVSTIMLSPP